MQNMLKNKMEETIINKVANSNILTFNLEDYYPDRDITEMDIKPFLYMEMILKEKEFREMIKNYDWKKYENQIVIIGCSVEAIIPTWAYMIIAATLNEVNALSFYGSKTSFLEAHYFKVLNELDYEGYKDRNVVIKGCGDKNIPISAYMLASQKLSLYVKKLFYGEPCSTVPVWRKK